MRGRTRTSPAAPACVRPGHSATCRPGGPPLSSTLRVSRSLGRTETQLDLVVIRDDFQNTNKPCLEVECSRKGTGRKVKAVVTRLLGGVTGQSLRPSQTLRAPWQSGIAPGGSLPFITSQPFPPPISFTACTGTHDTLKEWLIKCNK